MPKKLAERRAERVARAAELAEEAHRIEQEFNRGRLSDAELSARIAPLLEEATRLKKKHDEDTDDRDLREQLDDLSRELGFRKSEAPTVDDQALAGQLERDAIAEAHARGLPEPTLTAKEWLERARDIRLAREQPGKHHPASRAKNLPAFTKFGSGRWGAEYLAQTKTGLVGGAWLPVALPAPPLVQEGRPVVLMRSLLPHIDASGGLVRFMVQTQRSNAAAVVEPLQVKPESTYGLEWRDRKLSVVAHTSEQLNRFDLADAPALAEFLDSELQFGVEVALEGLLIAGVEGSQIIGENPDPIDGFLSTEGLIAQDTVDDQLATIRTGIGAIEAQGLPVSGIVMNDHDWTLIELLRDGQGRFMLDAGPGDRTARRLWNAPVALSSRMPIGTALLGDFAGSAALAVGDRGQILVQASENVADAFVRNAVVFRCEGRFALCVLRPSAFAVCDLGTATATSPGGGGGPTGPSES